MVKPIVYFDIAVDGDPLGCVTSELFVDKVPKTAENFCVLSTVENEFGYKVSSFHRIIPGCMCQGGDFTRHNGIGSKSIYGEKLDDENFILKHTGPGKCWTQHKWFPVFHLYCQPEWLDGKRVVFGQAKGGMDVVTTMESFGSRHGKTSKKVTIADCGQLS